MSNLAPRRAQRTSSGSFARFTGRIVVPAAGIGFALWGAVVMTGLATTAPASGSVAGSAPVAQQPLLPHRIEIPSARASEKMARLKAAETGKTDRRPVAVTVAAARCDGACGAVVQSAEAAPRKADWSAIFAGKLDARFATDPAREARFADVVSENRVTKAKLATLFGAAGTLVASAETPQSNTRSPGPAAERFGAAAAQPNATGDLVLAYADPSPAGPNGALAALSAVTPQDDETLASRQNPEDDGILTPEEEARDADGTALSPDYMDTPEDTPLPGMRPEVERRQRAEKPAAVDKDEDDVATPRKVAKPKREAEGARQQKLAYARPNNPAEERGGSLGDGLKNLFNRPRAGTGVAVYDISAAKVYMPDGSVLEAHSGIGNMADNPKYAHVKMKGPTPPHTYNLKMREKRFHGVEAIRMLPVDGRNKHGRDGFLTHSYLLRGGRAESHGCVAFKNYDKFLKAFKQGKIKQLVVVPGGGRAIARDVQKGRDA